MDSYNFEYLIPLILVLACIGFCLYMAITRLLDLSPRERKKEIAEVFKAAGTVILFLFVVTCPPACIFYFFHHGDNHRK